jgi:hypothetical protein
MPKKTISILAVAFTASTVACGGASETTIGRAGQQQSADGTPTGAAGESANESTNKEETAGASTPSPTEPKPATPTSSNEPACDRDALNKELSNTSSEDALTQHEHFRCLCDDKGYPLVGNINSKGATASTFCAAITEKGLL